MNNKQIEEIKKVIEIEGLTIETKMKAIQEIITTKIEEPKTQEYYIQPTTKKAKKIKRENKNLKWSDSEDTYIKMTISKYGTNKKTIKEIAKNLRRTSSAIKYRIYLIKNPEKAKLYQEKQFNREIKSRQGRFTEQEIKFIAQEYFDKNNSVSKIALLLNKTPASISNVVWRIRKGRYDKIGVKVTKPNILTQNEENNNQTDIGGIKVPTRFNFMK